MDIEKISFSGENPPISVLAAARLAAIPLSTDTSLALDSPPSFHFSNGLKLRGTYVLLRYVGKIANIPNFYGQNAYESCQIDEWLEYAPIFSSGSAFESACKYVDEYLEGRTFLVANGLSVADVAIWSSLAGIGQRWESLRKSKKYQNLLRWFNSILAEYNDALTEVTTTYFGKRGLGKPVAAKSKKHLVANQLSKNANGDISEKGKVGNRPSFEVDLPDAEIGKVQLCFAPEPSGYLHIGHSKAALLNQYFAQPYQEGKVEHSFIAMAASPRTNAVDHCTSNGDWKVVLSRRGRQIRNSPKIRTLEQQQLSCEANDSEIDSNRETKLTQKIQRSMKKMEISKFFRSFLNQIQTPEISDWFHRVLGAELKMKMVIYGIGSIESYETSRLQLSLAILLKRELSWIGDIEVFDPILTALESRILEALGFSVLSINEEGRRQAHKPTLFFMPHCEAELYGNLLQANREMGLLKHIVLFGNSFEAYEQSLSIFRNKAFEGSARHILGTRKYKDEFKIDTVSEDYFNAFHDISWHFFWPGAELQSFNS